MTLSELVTTLNNADDVIRPNIHAQVAEHRLLPGDIDVVATGQSRLEQRREIASEFCFLKKRSSMRVTAAERVNAKSTSDRMARWRLSPWDQQVRMTGKRSLLVKCASLDQSGDRITGGHVRERSDDQIRECELKSLDFIQDGLFDMCVVHISPKFVGESREATVFVKGFDLTLRIGPGGLNHTPGL